MNSIYLDAIPEVNHQEEEDDDDDFEVNSSSLKPNKLCSHSPSPSPHQSSIPPDRTLNQKFHVAALTGNLNTLQELLTKSHLPIDCRDKENSTALLLSCARGHYSCAEYLLKNGADPNARRITGASPLYFATLYHHTRIVELLLNKYKAVVDLSTFDGSTSLHVACEHGLTNIVPLFIHAQANLNAKMNDGTTAIMLACQNGHLSIVQMLISTGQCNVSIQRLDGVTPLFLLIQHGYETIFDYFIEHVDNIKDTIDLAREDGATPLFKACQKGYESLVNKLLKYKPNLELLKNGESVGFFNSLLIDSNFLLF
jgi:ankyrin repeat protein